MLSTKEIHRDSKLCPSCVMAICRTEGVTKWNVVSVTAATKQVIHQIRVDIPGIWLLKSKSFKILLNDLHLPRFKLQNSSWTHFFLHSRDCSCELFPREMAESWQECINHCQAVGRLQAELLPRRGLACPNCRQFNAKVSDVFCLFLTITWNYMLEWNDHLLSYSIDGVYGLIEIMNSVSLWYSCGELYFNIYYRSDLPVFSVLCILTDTPISKLLRISQPSVLILKKYERKNKQVMIPE